MRKFAILALTSLCSARAVIRSTNASKPNCHSLLIDVPVTATNNELQTVHVNDNIGAVELALQQDGWHGPNVTSQVIGPIPIDDTFTIYADLCFPDPSKDKHILHIPTHGGFFDHRYWDSEFEPEQYSYVRAATNAGYTVLNYDRLANGQSQIADPYRVVQLPLELEILMVLTQMARNGTLQSHLSPNYIVPSDLHIPAFPTIVHIGHSYGSQLTAAFLTKYGQLSNGTILTGFTFPIQSPVLEFSSTGVELASSNNPNLFSNYPNGYVVPASASNIQNFFFHRFNASDPHGFTAEALAYAESIKQPVSVGTAISLLGLFNISYTPQFVGPLQFFLAEYDWPVCNGYCPGDYDPAFPRKLYPNATAIETYVRPGSGHALTLHKNASEGYPIIFDFLEKNGL